MALSEAPLQERRWGKEEPPEPSRAELSRAETPGYVTDRESYSAATTRCCCWDFTPSLLIHSYLLQPENTHNGGARPQCEIAPAGNPAVVKRPGNRTCDIGAGEPQR